MSVGKSSIIRAVSGNTSEKVSFANNNLYMQIGIKQIEFAKTEIKNKRLKQFIKKYGIIEPVILYESDKKNIFNIINGLETVNCALELNIEVVPAIIINCEQNIAEAIKKELKNINKATDSNKEIGKAPTTVSSVNSANRSAERELPVYLL